MDESILKALESKVTNVGTSDIYKKKIGGMLIWLSPLSYTDQKFVQEALEQEDSINNVNDAKLTALARSIVGIDDLDLRKYRNGGSIFPAKRIEKGKRVDVKVDLAKYLESKILGWGQEFVDLAFEVFADISETSKKKFAKDVVLENTKEPRIELAELEVKVHQLRAQLNMPVLVEKPGSSYANLQGEPSQQTLDELPDYDTPDGSPEPPEGLEDFINGKKPSFEEELQEDTEEESESIEQTEEDDGTEVEEVDSESDILGSVEPPPELFEKPTVTIPSAIPPQQSPAITDSPIHRAMSARKMPKVVHGVPQGAKSSPTQPLEMPSAGATEVIETSVKRPDGPVRLSVDPPVAKQSINPRFNHKK